MVRNADQLVEVFRLGPGLTMAKPLAEISSPDLSVPTTAAVQAGRLWVVNARFGIPPTTIGSPRCRPGSAQTCANRHHRSGGSDAMPAAVSRSSARNRRAISRFLGDQFDPGRRRT